MRYLAISRFRLLTIVRTAMPIFVLVFLPPLLGAIAVSQPEPALRDNALFFLPIHASFAASAWLAHAVFLSLACLMSGKVKTAGDDVTVNVLPDLMDTAPVRDGERFWGEAVGTLAGAGIVHLCCLPLLATVGALSPLPTTVFVWLEGVTIALLILASCGAAWLRRAPRTTYSGTRGPRNVIAVCTLLLLAILLTSRPVALRDNLFAFFLRETSMGTWAEVVAAVENPSLLIALLVLIYAGTITYYYFSATRKRVWEN